MTRRAKPIVWPAEMPPALAEVLGIPNFKMHVVWMALRETGQVIEPHYEAEMAAALFFLIPLALEHGDGWPQAAAAALDAKKAAHDAANS
ncbi:MAG TPA: hypothetical protein VGL73_04280 [Caulobacteraceae bacterium]|jgi:hypothetical protein